MSRMPHTVQCIHETYIDDCGAGLITWHNSFLPVSPMFDLVQSCLDSSSAKWNVIIMFKKYCVAGHFIFKFYPWNFCFSKCASCPGSGPYANFTIWKTEVCELGNNIQVGKWLEKWAGRWLRTCNFKALCIMKHMISWFLIPICDS